MGIEFVAYADDCRVYGRVASLGERLTDLLNSKSRITVRGARLVSLADGHETELAEVTIEMSELYAIIGLGPRGERDRRIATDSYRIRLGLGPYVVLGNLHTPPDIDPIGNVLRRPAMVPLTNATVVYQQAGKPMAEDVGTLIINRLLTEWIAPVGDEAAQFPGARVVRRVRLADVAD